MKMDFNIIFMTFLIIILVSIQYTLNKILMILKEIKDTQNKKIKLDREVKKSSKGGLFQ